MQGDRIIPQKHRLCTKLRVNGCWYRRGIIESECVFLCMHVAAQCVTSGAQRSSTPARAARVRVLPARGRAARGRLAPRLLHVRARRHHDLPAAGVRVRLPGIPI